MKRYKKANDSIIAPEELKQRVINNSAVKNPRSKYTFIKWATPVAAILVVSLVVGSIFWPFGSEQQPDTPSSGSSTGQSTNPPDSALTRAYAVTEAEYPETVPYPDMNQFINSVTGQMDEEGFNEAYLKWSNANRARNQISKDYISSINKFMSTTTREFLGNSDGKNVVYSPVNVFLALSMLSEVTDGTTRQQLLNLLVNGDATATDSLGIEELRSIASSMWNSNYSDDGAIKSILASSLWMNQDISFVQSTMDTLANDYYASSYQGEMGSAEFTEAFQAWLNEQTGGLLQEQAGNIEFTPETILALATTVYYRAKWSAQFDEENNTTETFHSENGDVTCEFMNQSRSKNYYWSDKFSSVSQNFESGGAMWFLLPDEGVSVDELLEDPATMEFITADKYELENQKYLIVDLSVPKFDVVSDLDLKSNLENLGVTEIFDAKVSDFTPMTTDADDIAVSTIKHAARVTIDEEGCTAVAFTAMLMAGSAMPPEETIDFVLDRPFLFVITGLDDSPLFIGVVNQP